eukprot:jgi/Mesen1/2514/ME000016S01861
MAALAFSPACLSGGGLEIASISAQCRQLKVSTVAARKCGFRNSELVYSAPLLHKQVAAKAVRSCTVLAAAQFEFVGEVPVEDRYRLNNLAPQPGSRRKNLRKGRGIAAGQGASCGFGMRGQNSRSGSGVRPGFEGGQMPLYRRLPKLRGIAGGMGAGLRKYVAVNIQDIAGLGPEEGDVINLAYLIEKGLCNPSGRDARLPLKVMGDGEIETKVTIEAAAFTASAAQKLETSGCTIVKLPGKKKFLPAGAVKKQARMAEYMAKKAAAA